MQKAEYVPEIRQYLTLKRLQLSNCVIVEKEQTQSHHIVKGIEMVLPYFNHVNVASAGGKMQQLHKREAKEADP